jgi:DNA-binding GntR family transcriptional regulator
MLRDAPSVPTAENSSVLSTAAHETILKEIRFDIIFGRLRPRERLLENELSQRFGVGRYLVRSVLTELQRLGLVELRQNRGAVVKDPATSDVDHLYDLRTVLQREAASRIPVPASDELLERLEAANARYFASLAKGELDRVVAANEQFHQVLFGACGNPYLAEMIEQLWQKTAAIHCYAIGSPNLSGRSHQEHVGMIDALRKGDRATLIKLCVDHMMPALEAYKAAHGGWSARDGSGYART